MTVIVLENLARRVHRHIAIVFLETVARANCSLELHG